MCDALSFKSIPRLFSSLGGHGGRSSTNNDLVCREGTVYHQILFHSGGCKHAQCLPGSWLEASVSLPQASLVGLFTTWQLVSAEEVRNRRGKERDREGGREGMREGGREEGKEGRQGLKEKQESTQKATVSYILISRVMCHHFCHFLLAIQTKSNTVWDETSQGC